MSFKLLHITPTHLAQHPFLLRRLAHVHITSFLTNAVYAAIYPSGYSEDIIETSINRHRKAICEDPTSRYIGVVNCSLDFNAPESALDEDCSAVIAFGKYQVFAASADVDSRKDTSERIWPPGTNIALVNEFWSKIVESRASWGPKLGAHVLLDLLATAPEWMAKGAGGMIMKELGRDCDERSLPGFLEGSPEGLKAYVKGGFIDLGKRIRVDLGRFEGGEDRGPGWREVEGAKQGNNRGWYENVVMIRPAYGKTINDYVP